MIALAFTWVEIIAFEDELWAIVNAISIAGQQGWPELWGESDSLRAANLSFSGSWGVFNEWRRVMALSEKTKTHFSHSSR